MILLPPTEVRPYSEFDAARDRALRATRNTALRFATAINLFAFTLLCATDLVRFQQYRYFVPGLLSFFAGYYLVRTSTAKRTPEGKESLKWQKVSANKR